MNNNFHIPQAAHFREVIHSFWQVEGVPLFHEEHILPKGTVEVIFNFSDDPPILAHVGSHEFKLPGCFINGFNTMPVRLGLPTQHLLFGVQLHPLAVKKLFRIPACEFADKVLDLTLLDRVFHSLWQQLAEQDSFDNRVSVFFKWMERQIPRWQPQEKLVNDFLSGIDQHDLSVTEVANSVCYSPRQLSRKMVEATGMNTEEMLLYKKYLHAVHLIHDTDLSLTQIAYQSNFSDQSHFIKSFRNYTHMTPGEYKGNKSYLKGHLFKDVR